jgi:hypothetical protein
MKPVALGLVLVLALGGMLFWHYRRDADKRRGDDAGERLTEAARKGRSVGVDALADFQFDRLVVVYGTESAEDIDDALGFEWRRSDDEGYECCDPAPLWLFVNGDEVVAYLRPSRAASYGDCVPSGRTYRPAARLTLRGC